MIGNTMLVNITIYLIIIALSLFLIYWIIYLINNLYNNFTKGGKKIYEKLSSVLMVLVSFKIEKIKTMKGGIKK